MDNWGSQLLANPQDEPLFHWDPTTGLGAATVLLPAPQIVHGMFVAMPQQMIVAYGASTGGVQDPLLVAWCDAGNFNVWTANVNNEAGTYRLTRGSKIVGGIQGPLQCMLWTDVGLWLMQYIGYPNVWGFLEISRGCGLIAKKAVNVVGTNVYWMSRDGFWVYAGGGAMRLQCDVWDILKNNLNLNFLQNIRCCPNTGFDEVSWECPSTASASGENDIYVKFNVVTNEWDYGYLAMSEWIDQNVFGNPISAMPTLPDASGDPQSLIMQHEEVPERQRPAARLHAEDRPLPIVGGARICVLRLLHPGLQVEAVRPAAIDFGANPAHLLRPGFPRRRPEPADCDWPVHGHKSQRRRRHPLPWPIFLGRDRRERLRVVHEARRPEVPHCAGRAQRMRASWRTAGKSFSLEICKRCSFTLQQTNQQLGQICKAISGSPLLANLQAPVALNQRAGRARRRLPR